MKNITLADWWPTQKQKDMVLEVLESGRLTYGKYHRQLEKDFAKKHNFKYCIFTNSGTSALEIAWHLLKDRYKWPDGAEVIVPAVTFVATVNVLLHNKLQPVLVDIDPSTFNMDPVLIEAKINKKTVAICPVDLLGRPVDIEPIRKIARGAKLKIVEDSCETMFVNHNNGKPVGSVAYIACYSSYLAHIISTGVGGFFCTNDYYVHQVARSMIWHGRDNYYLSIDDNSKNKKKLLQTRFKFNRPGFSYRLTEMEAALGLDEVRRSREIVIMRKANAVILNGYLRDLDIPLLLPQMTGDNAWMFFPIVCKEEVDRDALCLYLEEHGIQTRAIMPLTNQPVFKDLWNPSDYPVADWINKKGFLIGIHHFLETDDLKYIAQVFKEYFKK